MEIIKKGNTVTQVTCSKCGCVFQYCEKDIKEVGHYVEIDGINEYFEHKYIHCPECNYQQFI